MSESLKPAPEKSPTGTVQLAKQPNDQLNTPKTGLELPMWTEKSEPEKLETLVNQQCQCRSHLNGVSCTEHDHRGMRLNVGLGLPSNAVV